MCKSCCKALEELEKTKSKHKVCNEGSFLTVIPYLDENENVRCKKLEEQLKSCCNSKKVVG